MWPELNGVALAARARPDPGRSLPPASLPPPVPGFWGVCVGGAGALAHFNIFAAPLFALGGERAFQPCFFKLQATLWPGANAVGAVMGRGTVRPGSARRGPQFGEGLTLTQAYGGRAAGEGWPFCAEVNNKGH